MIRRTRVEVDLAAVVANARLVARITGAGVYAVVKADGYGHGAIVVAQALERARAASGFAVSLVEEGVALRAAGITSPVLVLGPSQVAGEDEIVAHDLTPVIGSEEDLTALIAVARTRDRRIDAHLKVDTGMGRLGVSAARAADVARKAIDGGVQLVGLMTHFACADTDDPADPDSMTVAQLARFAEVDAQVTAAGAPILVRHAANSSGALWFPAARFDAVRAGIAIYGNGRWPDRPAMAMPSLVASGLGPRASKEPEAAEGADSEGARARPEARSPMPDASLPVQAMRLVTEVAQVRAVAVGESVGYGATWRAARPSRVAVLPLGYADGLPRRASGRAEVAIKGRRAPLVGLVSMDIAVADVTDIPGAAVGDVAVLLGRAGDGASISTAEFAAWCGLSEYEVTCGMSKRVPRTYVGEGAP